MGERFRIIPAETAFDALASEETAAEVEDEASAADANERDEACKAAKREASQTLYAYRACSYRRTSRTLPASGDGTPGQHEMRRPRGKCGRERREGRVKGA